ncbi:MAG: NTP/NDP exchange transporter [Candidatus Babeliales bacterium]
MINSVVSYFYPDLNGAELRKFKLLAGTLFLTVGAYWLLRLLKDTLFFKVCFPMELGWLPCQGRLLQPVAKFWSPIVVLGLVLVYSKLVDLVKRHVLFYIICAVYAVLFGTFALTLFLRETYGNIYLGKTALSMLGWVSYFAIESFGSLIIALFWSFTNSITTSDAARRGYPMIIAGAQLGAIGGSSLMFLAHKMGLWQLFALVTAFTLSIIPMMYYFVKTTPHTQMASDMPEHAHKKEAGFLEGIRLLATKPYLMGILLVTTLFEVINQILEYQMKSQADTFPYFEGELGFAQFQGIYGVSTNVLSFLMALLGTSYLIKRFGLRFGLLFFPVCLIAGLAGLLTYYLFGTPSAGFLLFAIFLVMIMSKGLGYAVNNPVKEMMYIPTSKDAKFKTKGFIDVFGGRMAKLGGAQINDLFKHDLGELLVYGTLFSFGLSAVWILAAIYVGNKNAQLVRDGEIVE